MRCVADARTDRGEKTSSWLCEGKEVQRRLFGGVGEGGMVAIGQ